MARPKKRVPLSEFIAENKMIKVGKRWAIGVVKGLLKDDALALKMITIFDEKTMDPGVVSIVKMYRRNMMRLIRKIPV